ncbi:MAG: glycosyltransferase family 39 protein [Elusimicrobiota bacterium]
MHIPIMADQDALSTFPASLLVLAGLLAFHAFQLRDFNRRETRPPAWDQSIQLETAIDLRAALSRGDYPGALLANAPKPGMPPFPPLYGLSLLPFGGGVDARLALWSNWLHLALLCLALWGLGRRVGGQWVGVAAAAIFSCVPEVRSLLRDQLVDLALTAWVAAAYWALMSSEGFRRRAPSLIFGALFAASMLAKWSAFSYFFPALFFFGGALRDPKRRGNVLGAVVVSVILCGPWYLSQLAILLPRLVEASADQATAVWRGTAALSYFRQMGTGLEFPLWALGIASLFLPGGRGDAQDRRLLKVWTISSFIFWTIVPNRQLRYLLPGLPPLALLCAAWRPGVLTWVLCAYQLVSAANSTQGWISRVSIGPLPSALFISDAPRAEDWKLADILREADARRDRSAPFSNLTLVANHPQFNPTNLHWTRLCLGLETLRVRGVNRRICEFSEFLAVKTLSLGPASVVNQLPGVQALVLDPAGWFQRGYKEVRRFPLPDGSEAVLFQRKAPAKAPFPVPTFRFPAYTEGNFSADDLRVDFGAYDPRRGVYPKVRIRAKTVRIRGLAVAAPDILMEDLSLVPTQQAAGLQDVRFLGMKRLSLASGSVNEKALAAFLEDRVNGLKEVSVSFSEGEAAAFGRLRGVRVAARVALALAEDRGSLTITAKGLKIAGVPIPLGLLGRRASFTRDFRPDAELPFEIAVPSITLSDGYLTIK